MANFVFDVKEFRRMTDPVQHDFTYDERSKYVFYAKACTLPDGLREWMDTNPRKRKFTTHVAENIRDSLLTNDRFHELNRGIVLSAESISFDNKTNKVELVFNDSAIHGNIDGGHTLEIILNENKSMNVPENRYVFFEVFTGLESPVDLAAARNTSNQVDSKSIEELKKTFEVLKEVLKNETFEDRIYYKMNEDVEIRATGTPIDVREIIAIINMFNQVLYPISSSGPSVAENHPIQSYTGKEMSLQKFLKIDKQVRDEVIIKMKKIIPTIFLMFDKIETEFPEKLFNINMRYGGKKYSKYDNNNIVSKSIFSMKNLKYVVPRGIIYPILGAFRSLIYIKENGEYDWIVNPVQVWNKLGSAMSKVIIDDGSNPEYLGKSNNIWSMLYMMVEREVSQIK
ncbi:MAG TPA: AIPR family protein [Acholeplasmataceae bacterium]|nr:AIPR family protein [Acholeplasmataceae bacterium]